MPLYRATATIDVIFYAEDWCDAQARADEAVQDEVADNGCFESTDVALEVKRADDVPANWRDAIPRNLPHVHADLTVEEFLERYPPPSPPDDKTLPLFPAKESTDV